MSGLMVQDLILLGLLKESPKHGYDLKSLIDERLQYITHITSGTVYYTLKKLEKQGFVTKTKEKDGDRPERNVYHISPQGEQRFLELLKCSFLENDDFNSVFDVGLYFVNYINYEIVIEAIDKKLKELEHKSSIIDSLERKYQVRWPFNLAALKEKYQMEIKIRSSWYCSLREKLELRLQRRRKREKTGKEEAHRNH